MCSIVKESWGIRGMAKCHYSMTQRLQPEIAQSLDGALLWSCSSDLALALPGAFWSHTRPPFSSFESTKLSCVFSLDEQGIMFWFLLTVFSIKTGLHCALWLNFKPHTIPAIFTLYNDIFPLPLLLKGAVSKTKFQQSLGDLFYPPRQPCSKAPSGPKGGSRWSLDSGWPFEALEDKVGFFWMLVEYTSKTMSINFITTILGESVSKALIMFSASQAQHLSGVIWTSIQIPSAFQTPPSQLKKSNNHTQDIKINSFLKTMEATLCRSNNICFK